MRRTPWTLMTLLLLLATPALADHDRFDDEYDDRKQVRRGAPDFYDDDEIFDRKFRNDGRLILLADRVERATDRVRSRIARGPGRFHPARRTVALRLERLDRSAERFERSVRYTPNPFASRDEFVTLKQAFRRADRGLDRVRMDSRTRRDVAQLRVLMDELSATFDARLSAWGGRRGVRDGLSRPRVARR